MSKTQPNRNRAMDDTAVTALRTATFDPPGDAIGEVPPDWLEALGLSASRLGPIADFVGTQRRSTNVLPPADRVFAALHATPFDRSMR